MNTGSRRTNNIHRTACSRSGRFGLVAIMLLVVLTGTAWTQESSGVSHGVYLELYGIRHDFSEGLVSLNYELGFGQTGKNRVRIGLYPDFESSVSVPISYTRVSPILGSHHAIEWGGGLVFRYERFEGNNFYDFGAILFPVMYRFQTDFGLFVRAGVNLFVSWPTLPSPSVSVGYRF